MFKSLQIALFVVVVSSNAAMAEVPSITVGTYPQQVATKFTVKDGLPVAETTAVAVGTDGKVYAGSPAGLSVRQGDKWVAVEGVEPGPVYALATDADRVLAAVGQSLIVIAGAGVETVAALPETRVNGISAGDGSIYVATNDGLYTVKDERCVLVDDLTKMLGEDKTVNSVACGDAAQVAVAANAGLFVSKKDGKWKRVLPSDDSGRSWAPNSVQGVAADGALWFASRQGVGKRADGKWLLFEGSDGLPYNEFRCMAAGKDAVWFGTSKGAIRYDGTTWEYRQGRRWLPGDDIADVAVDANGNAWFATSEGVGLIELRMMTLAEKAAFYESEIDKYNRRTEYGYVLEATVDEPGEKKNWRNHDSDNDGLWTSMYGAGECYAWAATGDPKAKERARDAFEALRFLSVAPIDGEVKQQPGFVARTVVPTTEPDPNLEPSFTLEGQIKNQEGDSLWKAYVPRWPLSKDKKYWYKTDTSSDELDGHYFFYGLYYDLVADSDEEKERVREVVRNLTDHLVRNDFCLVDHDGKPTRWAVYSPKELNHNPLWQIERGLNSLSMLAYLAVAEHLTGDTKYADTAKMLCEKHGYDSNAMVAKIQFGFGSGNQSDDEMAIMSYYNLLRYSKDEVLKQKMLASFQRYMFVEWPEMNPFFNMAYGAFGLGATFTNAYNTWDISPVEYWLTDSVDTLKRFPMDRFNWAHENSHRIDITMLPFQQRGEFVESWSDVQHYKRGVRPNGKVIPVDERHFNHWNTDPYDLDYGGNGKGLADGAAFLLPYYMGLYHGFIK